MSSGECFLCANEIALQESWIAISHYKIAEMETWDHERRYLGLC